MLPKKMPLRRATPEDAPALARVHRRAMQVSLPFLPTRHTPEEDRWYFEQVLLRECEAWVAEVEGAVGGYVAFRPGWVEHLYVLPERQGAGLGSALLSHVLADGTPRQLWTFQQNLRARAFYERRGFVAEELTDGARNEERMPDVRYAWRPGGAGLSGPR